MHSVFVGLIVTSHSPSPVFDLRKIIVKFKRRSDWVIYNVKKGGVTSIRKASDLSLPVTSLIEIKNDNGPSTDP